MPGTDTDDAINNHLDLASATIENPAAPPSRPSQEPSADGLAAIYGALDRGDAAWRAFEEK